MTGNFTPEQQELSAQALKVDRFPRAAQYAPGWIIDNEMGPNVLWMAEWLSEAMDLRHGMRVLDIGCGRCLSSVFLAREFGVQVWANDLWIEPGDNWKRIRQAGLHDQVFPIHAEARSLPYATEFFDAIVSLDSYFYYGTDEFYLDYIARFLRPGGQIGKVDVGLARPLPEPRPACLSDWPLTGCHTADWWESLWQRSDCVTVDVSDALADGGALWRRWYELLHALRPGDEEAAHDVEVFRCGADEHLSFVRTVARKL